MRQWHLIYDMPTTGPHNMAVDDAILAAVAARTSRPTLRLYGWNPPCLSLGYGQSVRDVDVDRLYAKGWDLVRRATGGRAILHTDELTYSVCIPLSDPIAAGGIVESYHRISMALAHALQSLGLHPEADRRTDRDSLKDAGPVCFEIPSHYEITAGGRKLIGSAQLRRKETLLQHGTLPLYGDITRICDALCYPDEASRYAAREQVNARAVTLEAALGRRVEWQEAADAVAHGFAATFEIAFSAELHPALDDATVTGIRESVFGSEGWTFRR